MTLLRVEINLLRICGLTRPSFIHLLSNTQKHNLHSFDSIIFIIIELKAYEKALNIQSNLSKTSHVHLNTNSHLSSAEIKSASGFYIELLKFISGRFVDVWMTSRGQKSSTRREDGAVWRTAAAQALSSLLSIWKWFSNPGHGSS